MKVVMLVVLLLALTACDYKMNGNESDIDCGGNCLPCADGLSCVGNQDCDSKYCQDLICTGKVATIRTAAEIKREP